MNRTKRNLAARKLTLRKLTVRELTSAAGGMAHKLVLTKSCNGSCVNCNSLYAGTCTPTQAPPCA